MIFFSPLLMNSAMAYTGVCEAQGGAHVYNFNLNNLNITDPTFDTEGHIEKNAFQYSGGQYAAKCDINSSFKGPLYVSSVSPLEQSDSNDDTVWYKLNEYMSASFETYVAGAVASYIKVPFNGFSNKGGGQDYSIWIPNYGSGGKGKVSIRIDKPFVGFSQFNSLVLHNYLSVYKETAMDGSSVADVYIAGSVVIPQSCELDAGTTISMDFGNIGSPMFSQAGAGNKPAGVNPQSHIIAVKCKNIDAQAFLTMRLETDNVSGKAMVSDNKDVGFIVADGSRNPLIPNDIDSKIRFQLDDNSAARVPITAWPVSVTGNKPEEGKFTAEGYLRIDFD
jgi:minor fimbrial subunit